MTEKYRTQIVNWPKVTGNFKDPDLTPLYYTYLQLWLFKLDTKYEYVLMNYF